MDWSSIGLPSDHTFIQEDDIEAIDSMGTLDIKSHHYGDTWVLIIFVQQNTYFVQKIARKKIHVAGYKLFFRMLSFILEQYMLTKLINIWRFGMLMVSNKAGRRRIVGWCTMNV